MQKDVISIVKEEEYWENMTFLIDDWWILLYK